MVYLIVKLVSFCNNFKAGVFKLETYSFLKKMIFIYVYGCFNFMCICTPHVCSDHVGLKRELDPLKLELQTVMK